MRFKKYLAVSVFLFVAVSFSQGIFVRPSCAEPKKPVVVPGKTFLPLRILARPFSNIYKEADEKSSIVEENVPIFQPYFVYTRPNVTVAGTATEGWYEVGEDNKGNIKGWMKAEDVMEWKQTMCLAYEHPAGRKPVLMFEKLDALRDLVKMTSNERAKKTEAYYQQIESKNIPADFPIVSAEPKDAIDMKDQFYLLPILEHSVIEIEGREGRLLKMAAATKAERGGGTLKNPEAATGSGTASANPEANILKKLALDLVYVVDTTASMQPYIDATLKAVKDISLKLNQNAEAGFSVRFGIWGYRDSMEIPGIEYTVKNYTPELQNAKDFEATLSGVKAASVGSMDYPEDVFSGVDKAMRETKWSENSLHIMILLGDAPNHELGHKWNASGQSAETLRTFASDNKYYLFALHIKDPQTAEFHEPAADQFKALSKNRGVDESSYWAVKSDQMNEFESASKTIADGLVNLITEAKKGTLKLDDVQKAAASSDPKTEDVKAKVSKMGYAALVDWIGRETDTKAPRDIIAWVTDKDLIDPVVPSLDVRVLINKKQIDSLKTVLQEIMTAGRRGIIAGEKFFDALQAVPSVASRAGDQIRNAKSLAETGLVPEFMQDLPYQSKIMSMSNDLWDSWSLDQQEEFLNEVDAKIQLYVVIHDEPKGWIALNKGDDPDEHVYPLSLTALP